MGIVLYVGAVLCAFPRLGDHHKIRPCSRVTVSEKCHYESNYDHTCTRKKSTLTNYGLDPWGWANDNTREQELKHSRLAMIAFGGLVTQSALGFPITG